MPEAPARPAKPPSVAAVRARLSVGPYSAGHPILYGEQRIGSLVSYGDSKGPRRGNVSLRTVYASRISLGEVRISEEGGKPDMVLGKVAKAVAAAIKAGQWRPASTPAAAAAEPEKPLNEDDQIDLPAAGPR